MMPLAQRLVISVITLAAVFAADACGEAVRVDLSLASGRKDTETPGWQEWEVAHGASVSTVIDGVEIELAAPGGELKGDWYKAGLATGATLATDGVTATIDDAQLPPESKDRGLVITLRGLAPGAHTLTTYHNSFGTEPLAPCSVHAGGTSSASSASVTPSVRAADNDGAATAYVEFDVSEGDEAVIAVTTEGDRVVLNGFAIDAPNPRCQARRPQPANRDWHADADDGTVRLAWEPADDAAKQRAFVVVADDAASGAAQLGELTADDATAALNGDASSLDYQFAAPVGELSRSYVCWRVDTIDADGRVTPGNVWTFRPRHLAFPGAEGYGRFAIGGRGGQVLHVTNLNDSGPGSLRAAVEAEGPRTVVFDVSGRIVLKDRLIIRNPYLTIAGQTAPGKGVCISNYNLGMLGAHDCIVRYIRVRPGDTAGKTLDGMGMAGADHAIIDHCSISWTQDEAFSSRGAKNITLQRTLISEALNIAGHKKYEAGKQHGYAASIGGDIGSFHHNLLAHCAGRNWSLAGGVDQASVHAGRLDLRNNVVYNWGHRTTDGGAKEVNFVNNYYRPGPASHVFHVLKPQHELPFGPQEYYVAGNVMEGRYGADQRYAGVQESRDKPMAEYIVEEPFFESFVTTTSAADAVADVLGDIGCNRPALDEHDQRVIQEVRDGTTTYQGSVSGLPGLPDSQQDVGGWEDYPEQHRPADWDVDGDGLPGWWEVEHGLNPESPAGDLANAHADADGNGFTNLEEYLQELTRP